MYKMSIENRMAAKGIAIVNFSFEKVCEFLNDETVLTKLNPTCL